MLPRRDITVRPANPGQMYAYGHSYVNGAEATSGNGWPSMIARTSRRTMNTRAVSSDVIQQTIVNRMFNGSGATAWTPGTRGTVLFDSMINDVRRNGTSGGSVAAWRAALEAGVHLARAASVVHENDASFAYTGSWSNTGSTADLIGNICKFSTTPGNYWDLTFTGDAVTVLTLRLRASTGNGGETTITDTADSSTLAVVSHAGGMPSNYVQSWSVVPVHISGLGPGSHTIRGTHTGTGSQAVYIDGYLLPSDDPPDVLVVKDQELPQWTTGSNAAPWNQGSDAAIAAYKTAVDEVAAMFGDGKVRAVEVFGWNKATMVDADDVHPNDPGHFAYANAIASQL